MGNWFARRQQQNEEEEEDKKESIPNWDWFIFFKDIEFVIFCAMQCFCMGSLALWCFKNGRKSYNGLEKGIQFDKIYMYLA